MLYHYRAFTYSISKQFVYTSSQPTISPSHLSIDPSAKRIITFISYYSIIGKQRHTNSSIQYPCTHRELQVHTPTSTHTHIHIYTNTHTHMQTHKHAGIYQRETRKKYSETGWIRTYFGGHTMKLVCAAEVEKVEVHFMNFSDWAIRIVSSIYINVASSLFILQRKRRRKRKGGHWSLYDLRSFPLHFLQPIL